MGKLNMMENGSRDESMDLERRLFTEEKELKKLKEWILDMLMEN